MRSLISAVAATVLVSCLASAADTKILTYCSEAAPEGFDPAPYISNATFDASSQVFYNRLVEFEPGTTNVVPGLAESWDISGDGLQYTFHLRPGVKFHTTASFTPKRALNADDVVFSLQRQRDKKNAYYNYAGGVWPLFEASGLGGLIKAVAKVDAATVKITLTKANSGLLSDLAMDFASILSKEYADALLKAKTRELLNSEPVGTGPFQFISYNGAGLFMVANRDYWAGIPPVSNLNFAFVPDPAERLARLKAGSCQVMGGADAAAVRAAKADPKLAVAQAERADVAFIAFNTSQPPFGDARVRKALGMAINRQAIVDAVYGGGASAANALVPSTMWGYDGKIIGDIYNADEAKRGLAEAGVSGLKVKLLATRMPRPYSPDLAKTAEMIASDFAKVGVEATVVAPALLSDYLRQSADKGRDGAVVIGWSSDNGDAGNFLSLLLSCEAVSMSNRAQWCDPAFTALIDQAKAATRPEERARLISEAQRIVSEQAPVTAIAHSLVAVPISKRVTRYKADPLGRHNFAGVDLSE